MKKIVLRADDLRFYGEEPKWGLPPYSDVDIGNAYTWYSYILDASDRAEIIIEFSPDDVRDKIKKLPNYECPNHIAAKICMISRGFVVTDSERQAIIDEIRSLSEKVKAPKEEVREKAVWKEDPDICKAEEILDTILVGKFDQQSFTNFLSTIKSRKAVQSYYSKSLSALDEEQHPEPLSSNLRMFYQSIMDLGNQVDKPERKPRKKKPVTPEKLVRSLKYLDKNDELGLESIDPKKIIGSKVVWIYNTKTRFLSRYSGSLSVKGSSIVDFDDKSISKKIRKPEELKGLISLPPKSLEKAFVDLKVKGTEVSGRVNSDCLILRVVR